MPYVWMDEVPRVQTVGACGIGVSPPVPVTELEKISSSGREMESQGQASAIPNPESVANGKVLKVNSGVWDQGNDSDSLPSAQGKANGQVLTVKNNAWSVEDPSSGSDIPDPTYFSDFYVLMTRNGSWDVSNTCTIINVDENGVLDSTFENISNAFGYLVSLISEYIEGPGEDEYYNTVDHIIKVGFNGSKYVVVTAGDKTYLADSEYDYPVLSTT